MLKVGRKYNIDASTINWTYLGSTTTGEWATHTFIDTDNWKRKQFKNKEIKNLKFRLLDEN